MIKRIDNLDEFLGRSRDKEILLFKHSNACPISAQARTELESFAGNESRAEVYMLTVQERRDLSAEIAEKLGVRHETPQLLFVRDGKVGHALNHFEITKRRIEKTLG